MILCNKPEVIRLKYQNLSNSKTTVSVDTLSAGMALAETIVNNNGVVVVWAGLILTEENINTLKKQNIRTVSIFTDTMEELSREQKEDWISKISKEEYQIQYQQGAESFKRVFVEIAAGKTPDSKETDLIIDSILQQKGENSRIVDNMMEIRDIDEYTYFHSVNVSFLSMMIGRWLKLPEEDLHNLVLSALMHDIGKCRIPGRILNKPGKLSDQEYQFMKKHAEFGYQIVKSMPLLNPEIAFGVLAHHERDDGSGYPLGLFSNKLHTFSKIISIADIFDAMTSNRVYKKHQSVFHVFDLMQHGSFGQLDPIILTMFLSNISHYYLGKKVLLSDQTTGEVVFMNTRDFSRPVVRADNRIVDLTANRSLTILDFIF
jgi:putative nucleotidyltransferase with HDIG domain